MKKITATVVSLLFFVSCAVCPKADFSDIEKTHYSYQAVENLKSMGIITGYADGTYGPQKNISRAEMATLICKAAGFEVSKDKTSQFPDVPKEHWASDYIDAAAKSGIVSGGSDGLFRPDDNVTYEEAIKMTVALACKTGAIKSSSPDWSLPYLEIADACGISGGLQGKKGENASRADVAVMLNNSLSVLNNPNMVFFANHLFNNDLGIMTNASFALDMSVFAKDNTIYNKELAKASCILSMCTYDYINLEGKKEKNTDDILELSGFESIEKIDLKPLYDDTHITCAYMAKKNIEVNGITTEVFCVAIRGTNDSLEEWSSNFEVGSGEDDGTYRTENHKGHDIAATRLTTEIEKYIAANTDPNLDKAIWITGHSRGAAIANICGKDLSDKGNRCYVYAFATPNITTNTSKEEYGFIFNILNKDDLITAIPLKEWGFTTYGKSAAISVSEKLLDKWQNSTGLKKYKAKQNILEVTQTLLKCTPSRHSCYEYRKNETIKIYVNTLEEGELLIEDYKKSFAENSLNYVRFSVEETANGSKAPYCMVIDAQPAFWLQNVAGVLGGEVGYVTFTLLPLPDYLLNAHAALISSYLAGLSHPHTPETYYTIVNSITSEDFK